MKNVQLTKQSQSHIRDNNVRLILNTLIHNEPLSRADIVRHTHISKPTVSALIDELMDRDIVHEIGEGRSRGGRKPMLLRFNSSKKHFMAFEMGRVGYRVAVSDLKGGVLKKKEGEFNKGMSFRDRIDVIRTCVVSTIDETGIAPESILKIICIAPGVYVEGGREMKWFPGIGTEEPGDIKEALRDLLLHEVIIDHSTKLSLLGEKVAGKARDRSNVVYIDFAYGLGCSVMINGDIYFGPNNSAGEIGYFFSSIEEFRRGRIVPYEFGALEKNISGMALQRKGEEAARRYGDTLLGRITEEGEEGITARAVFKAAAQGDPVAYSILKESFCYFNMALCNIINMLTPEIVIFGGGFSRAGNFLLSLIQNEISDKVLFMPELQTSDLANDASIIGGIHYLINTTDYYTEL